MDINELKECMEKLDDYKHVRDRLFIRLSPISEETMKNSPHHITEDLMITYHIVIPDEAGGFLTARVTNSMLESYGISSDTLHKKAMDSSLIIMKPSVMGLAEAVGVADDVGNTALVVTNEKGIFGASVLFYPGMMVDIAMKIDGSFYALPSSQHEFIIIPEAMSSDIEELSKMVQSANQSVVEAKDYLSDNVYRFDCITHRFEIANTKEPCISTIGA